MSQKKPRKFKRRTLLIIGVILFFTIYIIVFSLFKGKLADNGDVSVNGTTVETFGEKTLVQKEMEMKNRIENKKSLYQRFIEARKIYIGDNKVNNIRVDGASLENFDRAMSNFIKIRNADPLFDPKYKGKSSNGVEFLTDFNFFELISGNKREYYKIPVTEKNDFQNMYRKLIYTSVEFITNGDKIGSVRVYHGNEVKKIWFWKKKELINKILYKREVGKIQPEKEFDKTKDNYTIKLDKSGVEISIQTMGKDFIKVSCGDNTAYYEVYQDLYTYLNSIFK